MASMKYYISTILLPEKVYIWIFEDGCYYRYSIVNEEVLEKTRWVVGFGSYDPIEFILPEKYDSVLELIPVEIYL